MRHIARITALTLAVAALTGCETDSRTMETDDGGVLLTISDFSVLPLTVSASSGPYAQLPTLVVTSIVKNPGQGTSPLMNVEIDSYEVTYQRLDNGSRLPPRIKYYVFGSLPVGGNFTLENGPYLGPDQFEAQPLKDMRELGFDPETDSITIPLKVGFQFFGKTLSGDIVASQIARFTVQLVP
jgi:hypothetical protein